MSVRISMQPSGIGNEPVIYDFGDFVDVDAFLTACATAQSSSGFVKSTKATSPSGGGVPNAAGTPFVVAVNINQVAAVAGS